MNCLPLYVSILYKDAFSRFTSSSLGNDESMSVRYNSCKGVNTSTDGALIVTDNEKVLGVCEMDTSYVIIVNPHHKHVELDQVSLTKKNNLKSVLKDYIIREKFQT